MADLRIEQALYGSQDAGGYRFLARSPGFPDEWLAEAQRLCTGFGDRPSGVDCPAGVFALPFGRQQVAIVQVADQGTDDTGRPGALGFHLLIVPRSAYRLWGGDPFRLAERFTPPWQARGELPTLPWPGEPLPPRTVSDIQEVLKRSEGPALLGGTQVLVDGGRVVFERQAPDPGLLRALWTLLPTSSRCDLWPASFAFGNALGFDALVVPRATDETFARYVNEQQAENYPEGRYELNVQTAAEAGDQAELDALFGRRSRGQTWRLGLLLLAAAGLMALVSRLMMPLAEKPPDAASPATAPAQATQR